MCSAAAQDNSGHGTHVGGIAAAATNKGIGVAGTAIGSRLVPVQVCVPDGCPYAAVTNGIAWAAQHGARIINVSLGGDAIRKRFAMSSAGRRLRMQRWSWRQLAMMGNRSRSILLAARLRLASRRRTQPTARLPDPAFGH